MPSCALSRIFLKDSSFECPLGARIFLLSTPLNFEFAIHLSNQVLQGDFMEASLRVTLTAKIGEELAFIAKVTQCAILETKDAGSANFEYISHVYAPSVLAPYARATLADILSRATLASPTLPEIDWAQSYEGTNSAASKSGKATILH
jgi:preprotein translocase subunit SecB